jgi:hypothetical protein
MIRFENSFIKRRFFMKQSVLRIGLAVCILAIAMIFACAKPPTQEIADAEKAIADAKMKEADLYVEDIFANAESEMKKVGEMVAAKKYAEAKTAALEAAKIAQQAVSMVDQNKQKMKESLDAMMPDVQKALDEMKSAAAAAIKKKAVASQDELQSAIGKYELDMTTVKEQIETGKIRQAYDLAKSIIEKANAQKLSLSDAMAQQAAAKK